MERHVRHIALWDTVSKAVYALLYIDGRLNLLCLWENAYITRSLVWQQSSLQSKHILTDLYKIRHRISLACIGLKMLCFVNLKLGIIITQINMFLTQEHLSSLSTLL